MLVVTLVYEQELERQYLKHSKIALQAADNVLQWNIIDGLIQNLGEENIQIFNSLPMGSFPKANKKIIYKSENKKVKNVRMHNIGFLNLPLFKPMCRFFAYLNRFLRLKKNDSNVLIYGLYLPQLSALKVAKKWFGKKINATIIIDDLPTQYGIVSGRGIKKFLKERIGKKEIKILNDKKIIDNFVFLTEQMKDVLALNNRKYVVVEGIAKSKPIVDEKNVDKNKIVYYAGTLNKKFGVLDLVQAFSTIKKENYELWICGGGDSEQQIKDYARKDKRIKFFGFVDKNTADSLMQKATVLINPRKNDGAYTKYSFPSKTLEYMLSAKPIVMYKLDGIPSEYDKFIWYIDGQSTKDIAEKIVEVCEEKNEHAIIKAQEGREWIINEKNPKKQTEKIINLF